MSLEEAFSIVLELASANIIDEDGELQDERARQQCALALVLKAYETHVKPLVK